jgi:hypothetical protein
VEKAATYKIMVDSDENSRTVNIAFDFLDAGKKYEATIYRDAENTDWQTNSEAYLIEKKSVSNKSTLKIGLAKSGGCAMSIREIK